MKVTISPDMEQFVEDQVRSGRYQTRGEVLRAALQTLQAQELLRRIRLEQLRKEAEIGLEDLRQGRFAPLDVEAIKEKGRRIMAKSRGKDA